MGSEQNCLPPSPNRDVVTVDAITDSPFNATIPNFGNSTPPQLQIRKPSTSFNPSETQPLSRRGLSSSNRPPPPSPQVSVPRTSDGRTYAFKAQGSTQVLHASIVDLTSVLKSNHEQQLQHITALCDYISVFAKNL